MNPWHSSRMPRRTPHSRLMTSSSWRAGLDGHSSRPCLRPLPSQLLRHGVHAAGGKGRKAIDEIAARKESFEWGAFLRVPDAEAPPVDACNNSVPAAPALGGQVRQPSCQAVSSLTALSRKDA